MDALKRPLTIPPEFSRYAEEKGLFELYERMLAEVLVARPEDPLTFLHEYLSLSRDDVPRVMVVGPPVSGQHTISKQAARKLKAVHILPEDILHESQTDAGDKARRLASANEEIPETLWAEMFRHRLKESDCVNKGWIIEGTPRTREQALAFQTAGVLPKHFVHLEAPDSVLVERYAGKRIDPLTKDVYHLVFAPPRSDEVADRLVEEPGGIQHNVHDLLELYHRNSSALLSCYTNVAKTFNADQPIEDLFDQVLSYLLTEPWTAAPHTPRVVLLGPTGSGKSLQAANLARKYNLVEVDFKQLIQQRIASGSKVGATMKPFMERGMMIPDNIVVPVLVRRLNQLDCSTRGFVLHGFPLTREQAELLAENGHQPNRVYFLNIPEDSIKERLTLRRVDPHTGERFHLLFAPPPNQEVKDRLLIHPRFTEEKVMARVDSYNGFIDELVDYYTWAEHINADQDPLTVFECLEHGLVNPIPKQPPPPTDDMPLPTMTVGDNVPTQPNTS